MFFIGYNFRSNVVVSTQVTKYSSNIDDALKVNEAPQVSEVAVLKPDEIKMRKQLERTITIKGKVCYIGHT